jgi:hypothetical protein
MGIILQNPEASNPKVLTKGGTCGARCWRSGALLIGDILAHGKTVKCEPIDKSGSNKYDKLHKNSK